MYVERKLRSYLASCRDTIFYHTELKDSQDSLDSVDLTRVFVVAPSKRHKVIIAFTIRVGLVGWDSGVSPPNDKCVQRTF